MTVPYFEDRIRKLWQQAYPGIWDPQLIFVPCRTDVIVPHVHGRVPEVVELANGALIFFFLQSMGGSQQRVAYPLRPPEPPPEEPDPEPTTQQCIPIDGNLPDQGGMLSPFGGFIPLPTTYLDDDVLRPEGAPTYQHVNVDPASVTIRNWTVLPAFIVLITGSRQGVIEPESIITERSYGVFLSFLGGPFDGSAPLDVSFFDTSAYTDELHPVTWAWDFGDTGTGTGPMPTHQYTVPGTYTVSMTVQMSDGTYITVTKTDLVTVA